MFAAQDGDVIRYLPTHGDIIHVPDPEMHLVSCLHSVQNRNEIAFVSVNINAALEQFCKALSDTSLFYHNVNLSFYCGHKTSLLLQ